MTEARVVDTNVLIVASAANPASPFPEGGTPVDERKLRQQVLLWLSGFEGDPERRIVLDYKWEIEGEYQNKLDEQDYGYLVVCAKRDRNEVHWVLLEVDQHGDAVLAPDLASAVTDRADRKMVLGALKVLEDADEDATILTNACDTDWLDCADELAKNAVGLEHLIEEWLRLKWEEKKARK